MDDIDKINNDAEHAMHDWEMTKALGDASDDQIIQEVVLRDISSDEIEEARTKLMIGDATITCDGEEEQDA